MMKRLLPLLFLFAGIVPSLAQDSIFRKDNSVIVGRVIEISQNEIKYKRADLADGPVYTEKRSEIKSVKYSNGMTENFQNTPESIKAAATVSKEVKTRYVMTLTDGTKLKGVVVKESPREVIFLDDNIGERTIDRKNIATLEKEYGSENWVITLRDGTIISGKILSKDENGFIVQTQNLGVLKIDNGKVKSTKPLDGTVDKVGKVWFRNPVSTLYLLSPSAMSVKKGEGYYHNYYGLGNEFDYGITDHFSIGGGLAGPFGVYLRPKVSTSVNNYAYVAGGLMVGNSLFPLVNGSNFGIGLGFCSFTVGNIDRNLTASVCYGVENSNHQTDWITQPLVQLSGQIRVSKKLALVSENWMVSVKGDPFSRGFRDEYHYETFISYGARILNEKGSFDIGFINTPALWEHEYFVGIPYIGFVVHFGKNSDED
ncbi:MAG: hypothetical protein ACJ77K_14020 [Bacteroidia bacterium]